MATATAATGTSLFDEAVAALHETITAVNGGTVTLTRPGVGMVSFPAAFGSSTIVEDDRGVGRIETSSDDFIAQRGDLVLAGVSILPQSGDYVTVPDGQPRPAGVYEVTAPAYSFVKPSGALVEIHAKYTGPA